MTLAIFLGVVGFAVSAANTTTCSCPAVVTELPTTVVTLINPHPRTWKPIRIVTTVWTICHRFASWPQYFFKLNALSFFYVPLNPPHNQSHNKINLSLTQRPPLPDTMPFLDTFPTTCGGSVLSDEYWMPFHWRLFAIVFRIRKCRSNPGVYKLICVVSDGFETFGVNVISVFLWKFEFWSKFGFSKGGELFRYAWICHLSNYAKNRFKIQYAAYPTPNPKGSMIHGRHNGVSLNFQIKIPTAASPNMALIIFRNII